MPFMHPELDNIVDRILYTAEGALMQANTHAAFRDPGNEHWDFISILNSAHAGELFIKAIIARQHPLLIFENFPNLDDGNSSELEIDNLIQKGKTYDFSKLPKILWATTGLRIPDIENFRKINDIRNSIQHFTLPQSTSFGRLSLEFIYKNIDPLIKRHFNMYAIDFHEDESGGFDYISHPIIASELKFSIPPHFNMDPSLLEEAAHATSLDYRSWLKSALNDAGLVELSSKISVVA